MLGSRPFSLTFLAAMALSAQGRISAQHPEANDAQAIRSRISRLEQAPQRSPIEPMYVPFMLGTISLIAFLGLRNTYLAGAIRERCKDVRSCKCPISEASYFSQLLYFINRYSKSNYALTAAILAIVCFSAMIAVDVVGHNYTSGLIVNRSTSIALLLVGGVLATCATGLCFYETFIARKSLFTEIATSIITAEHKEIEPSLLATLGLIERIIAPYLDKTLHGKLLSVRSRLETNPPVPSAGKPAA
jgi:hypothetical protein